MNRQPLLMWRKETAKRAPNAIEDLDEFDRNMASVMFDRTVRPTGIILYHNRYSCNDMGDVAAEFERALRIPSGDRTPKQRRRSIDSDRAVARDGKIKFDPDNMGRCWLWLPFGQNPRWVELQCTNPDMRHMPLWLHLRIMEQSNKEADAFCTPELQSHLRAKLFDDIANVSEAAAAKQRQILGRAIDNKHVQASLARHVEVKPEPKPGNDRSDGFDDIDQPLPNDSFEIARLAGASRKDALALRPRPRSRVGAKPRTWAQQQRDRQSTANRQQPIDGNNSLITSHNGRAGKRRSGLGLSWKEAS